MKIEKNKVVSVSYEVTADGKTVDKMTAEKPLEYIHGTRMLLPRFEAELEGKEEGCGFEFELTPEEGYGHYDESKRVEIPKSAFVVDGKLHDELLTLGRVLPMLNSEGEVVQGMVSEIKDDSVVMDFNHPMADKTLRFKGEILSVRDASDKELKEGLHGEYLPKEGGCCHGHGGCCHGEGEEHDGCCHGEGGEHKCKCHGDEKNGHCNS